MYRNVFVHQLYMIAHHKHVKCGFARPIARRLQLEERVCRIGSRGQGTQHGRNEDDARLACFSQEREKAVRDEGGASDVYRNALDDACSEGWVLVVDSAVVDQNVYSAVHRFNHLYGSGDRGG